MTGRDAVLPIRIAGVETAQQQDLILTKEQQVDSDWEFCTHAVDYTFPNVRLIAQTSTVQYDDLQTDHFLRLHLTVVLCRPGCGREVESRDTRWMWSGVPSIYILICRLKGRELSEHVKQARANGSEERLRQIAASYGMEFVSTKRIYNTRLAHEATEYAREHGERQ